MGYILNLQQVKGPAQSPSANAKTSGPASLLSGLCVSTSTVSAALCM